ncbi:reverse transcriptase domain-containing protein [Tanacetum coccineum]
MKFLKKLQQLSINIPFIEALEQMPKYAKFMKDLLSKKRRMEETSRITLNERCSAIILNKIPLKVKDLGSFTIPCIIGNVSINKALVDLGASISLMSYSMFTRLGLRELKPTHMCIELDNKTTQYPRGIAENVIEDDNEADQYADLGVFSNQNNENPTSKPTLFTANTKEPEKLFPKLKELPFNLEYAFLDDNREFPDKKGTENLAADHLSRLENPELEKLNEEAIRDSFHDEHLMAIHVREPNADLWTTYKSPIGSTPFRIVYGKACHPPIEIEHKAYWALRHVNLDLDAAEKHRFIEGINVVDLNGCNIFSAPKLPFGVSERSEHFCIATPSHDRERGSN